MLPIINQPQLLKDLELFQEKLGQKYNWLRLEPVARCLHHLDDPTAPERFQECATIYYLSPTSAEDRIHMGNYYRLAGDHEQAHRWFHESYTMYHHSLTDNPRNTIDLARLVKCCYLLEVYDEVLDHAAFMRSIPRKHTPFSGWVEHLARSHVTNDLTIAAQVTDVLAKYLQSHPDERVSDTGAFTQWDLYEIAYNLAHPTQV